VSHRNLRPFVLTLSLAAVAAGLAGCLEGATEITCADVRNDQQSVRGDSVITTTGLIYRELVVGTGAVVETSSNCQLANVTYELSVKDGAFVQRTPPGTTFEAVVGLGGTIRGFEQGLVGMRVGGTRELIIPPSLGYASQPQRNQDGEIVIPANSTLIMQVTLVSVQPLP